jgi:iron complex transport system ATP-binding protein
MIEIKDLSFGYPKGDLVLKNISFQIRKGDILGIAGPNGAGKSTLLKLLLNLLNPTSGNISLMELPLEVYSPKQVATHIAWIGASSESPFQYTVSQIVKMGLFPHRKRLTDLFYQTDGSIESALSLTELKHLKNRYFHQLSSGEQQRVLLARAFVQNPSFILLDEAINHLDLKHQSKIKGILLEKNKTDGLAIVMISHHLNFLSHFANRLLLIDRGELVALGSVKQVMTESNIEKLYRTPIQTALGQNNIPLVYI